VNVATRSTAGKSLNESEALAYQAYLESGVPSGYLDWLEVTPENGSIKFIQKVLGSTQPQAVRVHNVLKKKKLIWIEPSGPTPRPVFVKKDGGVSSDAPSTSSGARRSRIQKAGGRASNTASKARRRRSPATVNVTEDQLLDMIDQMEKEAQELHDRAESLKDQLKKPRVLQVPSALMKGR
jgi:hypothetical protein